MPASPAVPAVFQGLKALAGCGGCAAKATPELVALLAEVASSLPALDPRVHVGLSPPDDAAVYALEDGRALVATVDFFPPIVDDPDDYGAIAAANALSDVYAMGGTVAFALAISGFPPVVPAEVLLAVNRAAAQVVSRAGGLLLGGHSIRCAEPVFGLCVMGFVDPNRIWRKRGARPGDALVLSKPIGTGILLSSGAREAEAVAVASMRTTNAAAAAALRELATPPSAVTDVSGYGLLGHAREMAEQSQVAFQLETSRITLLCGAQAAAEAGVRTSAHRRARGDVSVRWGRAVSDAHRALLEDPQTSGGLLAAVDPECVGTLEAAGFVRIGEVHAGDPGIAVA